MRRFAWTEGGRARWGYLQVEVVFGGDGLEEGEFALDVEEGGGEEGEDAGFEGGGGFGSGGVREADFREEEADEADVGLRVETVLGEPR